MLDRNKISRTTIATSENLLELKFDPFSREVVSQQFIDFVDKIQEEIFVEFKEHVLKHRGNKLIPESKDQIFSADVVTGERAVELGLVDEVGMFESTIEKLHPKLKVVNFS